MTPIETVRFLAHPDSIAIALAFSPTEPILASGDLDGAIRLWDTSTGNHLGTLQEAVGVDYTVECLAFSPDGTLLVSGPTDKNDKLTIWDVRTHSAIAQMPSDMCVSLAFSPEGNLLACTEETLTLRNPTTGAVVKELVGHHWPALSVAWRSDGRLLVSGGDDSDSSIRVWEAQSGQQIAIFKPSTYGQNVRSIAFFSDDTVVFINDSDQPKIWRWQSNAEPAPAFDQALFPAVYPTVLSPNGRYAASIDRDDY